MSSKMTSYICGAKIKTKSEWITHVSGLYKITLDKALAEVNDRIRCGVLREFIVR